MNIAIVAFTQRGVLCAQPLQQALGGHLYLPERLTRGREDALPFTGKLPEFVGNLFKAYEGIIFVSAVGIAVRAIAPHVKSKWEDPAVVVVDEEGNFAVSLLSGHWGGGNALTEKVARTLGATSVITTASDLWGIRTPEMVAKEHGLLVEHREDLPRLSALLLEGKMVVYVTDDEEIRQEMAQEVRWTRTIPPQARGVVFVTDRVVGVPKVPFLILRPRRFVLGVGMRRGISSEHLRVLVDDFLAVQGVAPKGVGKLASVERKRHEPALLDLAKFLETPIHFFAVAALKQVASLFPASERVERVLGVGSVARPSAFLASGRGKELGYFQGQGVTLALFEGGKRYGLD